LPDAKSKSYELFFTNAISLLGENVKALTITTDFEKALLKAVKKVFPNAEYIGCQFHFKQAVRRKLIEKKVFKQY
jgi:hypothetical protein